MYNGMVLSEAWLRLKPVVIGSTYYKMDPLVDRLLLSAAPAGAISIFYMAQQMHSATSQVFAKSVIVPVNTEMALAVKCANDSGLRACFRKTYIYLFWLLGGVLLIMLLAGLPVLGYVMNFGELTKENAYELWVFLVLSGGMLLGGTLGNLTAGAFYAINENKLYAMVSSISFTIGVLVKVLLFNLYGVYGLAFGVSVSYIVSMVAQRHALIRYIPLS